MALQAGILVSPLAGCVANCGGFVTVPVNRRAIGNRQWRCRPLPSGLQGGCDVLEVGGNLSGRGWMKKSSAKFVSQDARAGLSGEIFGSLPSASTSSPVPNTSSTSSSRIHRIPNEKTRTWQQADHLLVLVHGIKAGTKDWDDVIEVLRSELGNRFLIHASNANPTFQTFVGVDLAGKRLADEVWQIVRSQPGLPRISFVAHSRGGLSQHYAVANLYNPSDSTIVGLEPVHFVTIATPYLEPKESPLLLRMATDCNEGQFMFALEAFHSRVTYMNVTFHRILGIGSH